MRTDRTTRRAVAAAGALLLTAAPALAADSLSDSVEQFLADAQSKVDETKIWKFHVKPSLKESVIFTDNVYLNADDENPVTLTHVYGPGSRIVSDPDRLERIASRIPDFSDTATLGRKSDFILQSELGTDIVLPVNKDYSDAFKRDEMTILGVKVRNQEYLDRNELDNSSIFLHTDLFGFVNDLLNREWGSSFWVRVKDDYSVLKDPLDTEIHLLRQTALGTVADFHDFGRKENTFNFDTGWTGSKVDASAGYEKYNLWLDDPELRQAEHGRHNFHAEVGSLVPGWEQQRAYLRYDVWIYHFAMAPLHDENGVSGHAQILNDATVQKGALGVAGPMISDRTTFRAEAGYAAWNPHSDGLAADDTHYAGFMGLLQAVYRPWEERNSKVTFEYKKTIDYSAISNFNLAHSMLLQLTHELVPKRWDADLSGSFTLTSPSDGPDRKLIELGAGITYHAYKQLDVSLRYVFRHQTATNEIVTSSAFARGSRVYQYEIRSDSEFVQSIVELGVLLHF